MHNSLLSSSIRAQDLQPHRMVFRCITVFLYLHHKGNIGASEEDSESSDLACCFLYVHTCISSSLCKSGVEIEPRL